MLYYRKKDGKTYQGTTWQIKFKLDTVDQSGTYKLRVAIAEATLSELQVYNMTCIYVITRLLNFPSFARFSSILHTRVDVS